jgi:anti-sigma regulatory factor (Ser/Thr protein kinase)
VGAARRSAVDYARDCGFDESGAGRIGIIATELASNLVRHAGEGVLVVQWLDDGHEPMLEVMAVDRGPGMTDVARCMSDGYTTGGNAGYRASAPSSVLPTTSISIPFPGRERS